MRKKKETGEEDKRRIAINGGREKKATERGGQ